VQVAFKFAWLGSFCDPCSSMTWQPLKQTFNIIIDVILRRVGEINGAAKE